MLILVWQPEWFEQQPAMFWWATAGACVLVLGLGAWFVSRVGYRNRRWLAQRIEAKFPTLKQRLITAVEVSNDGTSRYLRKSLSDETLLHAYVYDWKKSFPGDRCGPRGLANIWGWFLFGGLLGLIAPWGSAKERSLLRTILPLPSQEKIELTVEPGNADVERGVHCLITARFPGKVPDRVELVAVEDSVNDGTEAEPSKASPKLAMQRSLSDPLFAAYLPRVMRDTTYHIEYEDGSSERYRLKVFDYPALLRSDAELEPPDYAQQEKRIVKDTRRVTVPEGTRVTWHCQVNKPLASFELVDEKDAFWP